jgi:hypothetical protein
MKKLFISQPMRGKTDEEIRKEREIVKQEAEALMQQPVEVIDSFFAGNTMKPLECLGESLKLLANADVAYFASGWEQARGCRIEWRCAKDYGILRIEA